MSTLKHTPGPWFLANLSEDNDPQKEKTIQEWSLYTTGPLAYLHTEWGERGDANARLMAAAPEMLEALQNLYLHCAMIHTHWGDGCNQKESDAAIKAGKLAINKALGK